MTISLDGIKMGLDKFMGDISLQLLVLKTNYISELKG